MLISKLSKFILILLMLISLVITACKVAPVVSPASVPAQTPATEPVNTTAALGLTSTVNPQTPTSTQTVTPTTVSMPVPTVYQPLYTEIQAELSHFESVLNQKWDGTKGQTIFATEEAFANGNVGEGLLLSSTMENNKVLLDRLQAMGVKGVVLGIKFPILMPDFPRSADYLKFYKDIAALIRQHNMKILVECGAVFAGTPYSPISVDWSKYTTQTFLQRLQSQLIVIAREIQPDYLTLGNEPLTEEALTKLRIGPAAWGAFIASTAKLIDRSNGMLVGAGTGTWENAAYIQQVLNMPGLDYIDLHLYPLSNDASELTLGLDWATQARNNGKRVTVSESWLWKATPVELGQGVGGSIGLGNTEEIMNRDVYSFWSPLDARYMQDVMNLADAAKMDFVSFFWMRSYFTYLDYDKTPHNLSTIQYNRLMNQAGVSNVQTGTLSDLGQFFQQQLKSRAR
jgi:hypothetical protein